MLSSLKKWVQDVTVDLAPPTSSSSSSSSSSLIRQPSTSSGSFSSSIQRSSQYSDSSFYSSQRQNYNERSSNLSSSTTSASARLSRPISMDSMRTPRTSKTSNISVPPVSSPVELDLSHLNREEQEHIANVLKRARAVDEQQSTNSEPPAGSTTASVNILPQASTLSASSSSSTTISSKSTTPSSSTTSLNAEQTKKHDRGDQNDNHADNEINQNEITVLPEPTPITVYRSQPFNKEKKPNGSLPSNIRSVSAMDERILSDSNSVNMNGEWNFDPPQIVDHEDDKIYDNIMKMHEEQIKENPFVEERLSSSSRPVDHFLIEKNIIKSNEHHYDDDERRSYPHSKLIERTLTAGSAAGTPTVSRGIRPNNLTEIDESDFFYQDPSPYTTVIDHHSTSDQTKQSPETSYKIDEFIEEDDHDERDHVKELEETIANLSRHFPFSGKSQNDSDETNLIVSRNIQQSSSLSAAKIDVDSILEMEIESPSTDDCFIQSPLMTSMQISKNQVNIPISVPISVTHRHGSLSRSSGIRENLKNLLTTNLEPNDRRSPKRTSSISIKQTMTMHRQRRNLPSLPLTTNHLQLRRANSESRFSLPAVSPSLIFPNSNIDDEIDLLEIDLNDPTGSLNRAARSKTESELAGRYGRLDVFNDKTSNNQCPSFDEISNSKRQIKQLKDQTTNTPPISILTNDMKSKKKLKKKGSLSPVNNNKIFIGSNELIEPKDLSSPTNTTTPKIAISSSTSAPPMTNVTPNKLQKSTSTEISYPFPVSKLILIRDNLSPSRQIEDDLGFRITGGHSIVNCIEVTARIEKINVNHKNFAILKNAVQEGDEVLEIAGVTLRGKSALFVKNLTNSIENEFEIVVRSKNVNLNQLEKTNSVKVENVKQTKTSNSTKNSLTVNDPNGGPRRHSMDTSQLSPAQTSNSIVVKSQSTIMNLPVATTQLQDSSEQLNLPTMTRKKSVSSKERLFSVESLRRTASAKSVEHNQKLGTTTRQSSESQSRKSLSSSERQDSINKEEERSSNSTTKTIKSSNINHLENKTSEESSNHSLSLSPRRIYEHRNSLLPNDPGLNGAGSNLSIDRRNSNESDESDNLSQYFRSPQSRKNSLFASNEGSTVCHSDGSDLVNSGSTLIKEETAEIASRRLQTFLQASKESSEQARTKNIDRSKSTMSRDRKSFSSTSSFKFLKKKTKSGDLLSQTGDLSENGYVGDIEIQISHNSEREQLVIRIIQAKNLIAKDTNGYSDPFVKVYLLPGRDQENKRRTKHVSRNLNPVWDHTVIYGHMHREELQYKMIEFTVWDYDRFKANDFLGQVTINLKDGNVINDKPRWYRLQAHRSRDETSNRGSSLGLNKESSADSKLSSNSVNIQSHSGQRT